jgi:hypothetical protein
MTSEERLDQLEPLLAENLQKTDRLIEGQARIIDEVSKIPGIEARAIKTAEAIARLTVSSRQQYEELRAGQENLKTSQELILSILREKLP